MALHHIIPNQNLQEICMQILIQNLSDEDSKVREEAAKNLISAKFFWPQDGNFDNCTVTKAASKMASKLLLPIIGNEVPDSNEAEKRLLFMLQSEFMTSNSSTMTSGLVEALLKMFKNLKSNFILDNYELLQQCARILTSRIQVVQDINFHGNILKLVSHLMEAIR